MIYVLVGGLVCRKGNTGRDQHRRRGLCEWLAVAEVLNYRTHEARRVPAVDDRGHQRASAQAVVRRCHPDEVPSWAWAATVLVSGRAVLELAGDRGQRR